jgi:hypothetical protein
VLKKVCALYCSIQTSYRCGGEAEMW